MSIRSAVLPTVRLAALLCALSTAACTTAREPHSLAKENAAMTASSTLAEPSGLTAQALSERVLALIQTVRGVDDLSPDKLRDATGLPITVNPDDRNDYGANGPLTDVWFYGLRSMSPDASDKPNRVMFQLSDQTDSNADMGPVCVPIDTYEKTLAAAGFSSKKMRNRLNTQDVWEFSRDGVGATVYVRGKSNPGDAQTCVSMVIIETSV